jgi:hypothetical protein
MISYSRKQTPFVESLYRSLHKNGFSIWLDYHCLVPSKPWFDQIKSGIEGADTLVLVVSRDSIASKNVEPEWRMALELKKRIILLIFEATPLPEELRGCEWVDFRVWFRSSSKKLQEMLEAPQQAVSIPAPQQGFKAPLVFWASLLLSSIVAVLSVSTWWTVFLPYLLVPLPWQIYKRNYQLGRVIPALAVFPVFAFFSVILASPDSNSALDVFGYYSTILPLIFLLYTPGMQRRGQAEAARERFYTSLKASREMVKNRLSSLVNKPPSVDYEVEYAPEDESYATLLVDKLHSYGHRRTSGESTPGSRIFVLISNYKTGTAYDPDRYTIFPTLLQTTQGIQENLQHLQWLDLRSGKRNLDKIALYLPEPVKLVDALGIVPTGAREVFPRVVNFLQYYFLLIGVLGGGSQLADVFSNLKLIVSGQKDASIMPSLFVSFLLGTSIFGALFLALRGLRTRRGGVTSMYSLLVTLAFIFAASVIGALLLPMDENMSRSALFAVAFYISLGVLFVYLRFDFQNLRLWLPRHREQVEGILPVERLFLLYPPSSFFAWLSHLAFHVTIFLWMSKAVDQGFRSAIPLLVAMVITRGLAWFISR